MKKFFLAFALALLFATSASAGRLIDNFTDTGGVGDLVISIPEAAPMTKTSNISGLSGVLKGRREIIVSKTSGVAGPKTEATVWDTLEYISLANGSNVVGEMTLCYGSLATGGTNFNNDWQLDLGVDFTLISADQDGSVTITIETDAEGDGLGTKLWAATLPIPTSPTSPYLFRTFFTDPAWTPGLPGVDLADVDGICFRFFPDSGDVAWDIAITQIETTIPEPATLSLLGVGLLAVVRRRRKSR